MGTPTLTPSQAGQERFRTLSTSFYRGAHGVLLVYDISSRASFLTMDRWFEEVHNNTVEDVALYLVRLKLSHTSRFFVSSLANLLRYIGRYKTRQSRLEPRSLDRRRRGAGEGAWGALL